MLERYFIKPETVDRIRGAFLGMAIDKYVTWLSQHAYTPRCVHQRVPVLVRFGEFARQRGAAGIPALHGQIEPFIKRLLRRRRPSGSRNATRLYIRHHRSLIEQFLRVVQDGGPKKDMGATRPFTQWAPDFFAHLCDERGLSATTIHAYAGQLQAFERYVDARRLAGPRAITPNLLDGFLAEQRAHVCARSLASTCGVLRAFLTYLFRQRIIDRDVAAMIDRPRAYRLSDIPRSISTEDVERTLSLVDRRSIVGKRDYAMLLLLVAYGLRAREVAALTLDDLDWHGAVLHVRGRKAGHAATYPLAAEVGEALLDYLQHSRPHTVGRTLFFRAVAPRGAMTYQIVSDRAQHYLLKAGVDVARPGSHTFRHSCAQRLVDAGFSLKVIGDFLGHRSVSSTRIYSKVALDGLREVALGDGEAIL